MKEKTKDTAIARGYYPPLSRMLRDLSPSISFQGPDKATLRAPVQSAVRACNGAMLAGVLAALMDVLGGGLALTAFHPDWAATTHLSVQSSGRALSGYIEAEGELRRTGRNTVLVMADIRHAPREQGGFTTIAKAMIDFTRFSPREGSPLLKVDPVAKGTPDAHPDDAGLIQPFYDKVGLKVLNEAEALVQVDMSDYVRNSFNALHGGVIALLADLAGQTMAGHAAGRSFATTDLAIHFLSLGEIGPFQTKTTLLRKTSETVLSLVEILDMGAGGRLLSIATNLATPDDPG